jgi:transcriptional regulator with XRE-family HTH domain
MIMPEETAPPHIGRKIERIRTIRGMKQETLAALMKLTQGAISRMEQSATVEESKLKAVAEALGVTVETIQNFDENALLGTSNFYNPQFQDNSTAVVNNFNSVEKIVELYERLLESEREKVKLLESILKSKT